MRCNIYFFIQLRKQLSEALEKQQKSEHERTETETKVMEVSGGGGGESFINARQPIQFHIASSIALFQGSSPNVHYGIESWE